jgi:hypothetical protein
MAKRNIARRAGAIALSATVALGNVPPAGAIEKVVGTVQVSGPAWVASGTTDWSRVSSARPLLAGDRLKTGSDGYLLADLGDAGVVGLYGNAEVLTADQGAGPVVDVQRGKVAFHMSPNSRMKVNARGAAIASGAQAADGYVEYDASGVPVVVVEDGSLTVDLGSGAKRTLARGERLTLADAQAGERPVQVAAAEDDERRAGAAASGGDGEPATAGIGVAGWTAVAVVAGALGGAVYYGVASGDNDRDSPSGD